MKCLIINGSPRKMNTWALVEETKKCLDNHGYIEYDEVNLIDYNLPMCRGCINCIIKGEGKCPHYSVLSKIIAKIDESDLIIVTSPVYSLGVSGLLKNFIDHMSFNFHRPRYHNKRAIVLSTTAGAGGRKVAKYVRDVLMFWGFNRVYDLGIVCYTDKDYKPSPKVKMRVCKISSKAYNDVANNKLYRPSIKRVVFYNAWRGLSIIEDYDDSADHRYWKDTGMINTTFAEGIPVSLPKRLLGNLLFKMIKGKYAKK